MRRLAPIRSRGSRGYVERTDGACEHLELKARPTQHPPLEGGSLAKLRRVKERAIDLTSRTAEAAEVEAQKTEGIADA